MAPIDVWLNFESDNDRQRYLDQQRTLPSGDLIEDERGVRYRLDTEDENAALVTANKLRNGFCEEAGIDREHVKVSLDPP
jgi:hypothetical protein